MKRMVVGLVGTALLALALAACSSAGSSAPATTSGAAATKPAAAVATSQPAAQSQAGKGPRIAFETESYDFGDMKFNKPADYVFKFRNAGDAPLIVEVEPAVKAVEGC